MSATQHSTLMERLEIERKEKLLKESHAELYSKFRNFRINGQQTQQESSESSNDENEEPTATDDPDYSPEYIPSGKCAQKVVRAFSADQSVVEVLPDNASSFGEPSFVKGINNGVLRLPMSHQVIASSNSYSNEVAESIASQYSSSKAAKKPIPLGSTSKRRLPVSSSKKPLIDNSQRPWLKQFPAKESASSVGKAGRILRPLNLDSHMAAVAVSSSSTSSTTTTNTSANSGTSVGNNSSGASIKHTKRTDSANSHQIIVDMDIDDTESFENDSQLKLARSMPALDRVPEPCVVELPVTSKTSEAVPPSAKKMPPPAQLPKPGSVKPSTPMPVLKSLKMLAPSLAKVPKMPERQPAPPPPAPPSSSSSSSAKPTPAKVPSKSVPAVPASSSKSKPADNSTASAEGGDLKTITIKGRHYKVLNRLGRGGSAVVYQVFDLERKCTLALKTVDLRKADKAVLHGFRDEIKLLASLRDCKRVVRMYDYEFRNNDRELFIVMEKGDDDLSKVIQGFQSEGGVKKLSPHMIRFYWQEMVKVVNEIHVRNIVHSDLKPVNFIIVSGKLKLIDFGIANKIQSNKTSVYKESIIGTADFMAPESFQRRHKLEDGKSVVKYNQKADIWSLGVILFNLVYGYSPFAAWKDNFQKSMAICNETITFPHEEDPLLVDVIKKCLTKDPTQRPTAADLLTHPYLTGTGQDSQSSQSALSSRASSSESIHQTPSNKSASAGGSSAAKQLSTDLLSKLENLTPNTLKSISKMVEETLSKK